MTKQEAAIKYITENYLDHNRLRHDVVSDKLQIRMDLEEAKGERLEAGKRTSVRFFVRDNEKQRQVY